MAEQPSEKPEQSPEQPEDNQASEAQPTEQPQPKKHISYSALNDFLQCGKAYQLKRMLQLPERPAWWNVGGHAVHTATEFYDRQRFATSGD